MMTIREPLARLAGARPDILAVAPGDLARMATLGGVLISTSALAGVSAFFALYSVLDLAWPLCAVVGVVWAIVILNLDRMLVMGMNGMSMGRALLATIPRVALALVLGAVISTPLVLRIFQPEINAELTTMKAEAVETAKRDLDRTFARISELEAEEARLTAVIAGRGGQVVADDPDVKAAKATFDSADKTYREAEASALCEFDGTCGTGAVGDGRAYREKKIAADRAREARDSAKANLDQVTATATERSRSGSASEAEAARKKLPVVQSDLAVEQERRREAESEALVAQDGNTGLLARLTALDRVTEGQPGAGMARWALFLLFLSLELLPVISKLLTGLGNPSLYDRLAHRRDEDADIADQVRADTDRKIVEAKAQATVAVTRQQVDAQVVAGKTATDALVDKQTKIALKAVEVWGELAMLRSDEELDRWLRAQFQQSGGALPAQPRPAQPNPAVVPPAEQTVPMRRIAGPNGFGPTGGPRPYQP